MTPLIVILMVAAVLIWEFLRRRLWKSESRAEVPAEAAVTLNVEGFSMPQGLYYHPLHTWAKPIDEETAVVGVDDMAGRLMGKSDHVIRPVTGEPIEAGQSGVLFRRGERLAAVVSPISGTITEVNSELGSKPNLVAEEPYGRGWLYKIKSSTLAEQLSTLLTGGVARKWMESSIRRLKLSISPVMGAVAQDGGYPLEDIGSGLGGETWVRVVREFLGTEAESQ